MADNPILNIFEYLQMYETVHLEKLATLRSVEDEICKEYQQLCQLKLEVKEEEETSHSLQENQNMLEIQHSVKTKIKTYMDEQLVKLHEELQENNSRIVTMELSLDDELDGYVESVLSFNESIRLDTPILIDPLIRKREKTKQISLEEDVLRCELKVREDLENEVKFLFEKLQNLTKELTQIEDQTAKHQEIWNNKISEALKMRKDLQDPGKQIEIKNLEDEYENVQQESEFLMAALDGVKRELEKKNFRRFAENCNFVAPKPVSQNDPLPSMAQMFTRNVPSPLQSPSVNLNETSSTEESSLLATEEELEERSWMNLQELQKDYQQNKTKFGSSHEKHGLKEPLYPPGTEKRPPISFHPSFVESQQHPSGCESVSHAQCFTRDSESLATGINKENKKSKDSNTNQLKSKAPQFTDTKIGNINYEKQEQPTKLPKIVPGVKNPEKNHPEKSIKFKFCKSSVIHFEPENQSSRPDEGGRRVTFSSFCEVMRTDPNE